MDRIGSLPYIAPLAPSILIGESMPGKQKPNRDDPEQSKRFIEIAKEVGADDDVEALERAFKKITSKPSKDQKD